jgi:very-short-patch-repair endonuclease
VDTNCIDRINELAAGQAGAFTVAQATAAGVERHVRRRLVGAGVWIAAGRGLLTVAGAPPAWHQQLWLAVLDAGPGAVVSGRAAAALHRLRGYRELAVEVTVPRTQSHEAPLGRRRETRYLPSHHRVQLEGLPVTSMARTIFDLAGDPGNPVMFRRDDLVEIHERQLRRVVRDAMVRRGLTMPGLIRVTAALARRGRAGSAVMRSLVRHLGAGYRPTESELEDAFLDLIDAEGLERPENQVDVVGERGWLGRVDFMYRSRRLIIEVDGPDHDDEERILEDKRRDDGLAEAGWSVIRIHWTTLLFDADAVAAEIRRGLSSP